MESIRQLQKKLQSVQHASNSKKVSERNCVDLLTKLIDSGFVKLYHTANGKEWLTQERLDIEIKEALASNGGRISIAELPNEIGVAPEHCEARAELLCKGGGLTKMHGELLAPTYVCTVAEEIEDSLRQEGCVAVSELSRRLNLPSDFIRSAVLENLHAGHTVKQNVIYTQRHAAVMEASVRGALRACSQPVSLADISGQIAVHDVAMVAEIVQRLIDNAEIAGRLQAATFVPKVFSDRQASSVDDFFKANQYMTSAALKPPFETVKDWVKSVAADGRMLSTAFVANAVVASAAAEIAAALAAKTWVDVQQLLPLALPAADARELLLQFETEKRLPKNAEVIDHIVLSGEFLDGIASRFKSDVRLAVKSTMAGAADDSDEEGETSKADKKAKRSLKGRKAAEDAAKASSCVSEAALKRVVGGEFPGLSDAIVVQLCSDLQRRLEQLLAKETAASRDTLQVRRNRAAESTEEVLQRAYERLVLGVRALESTTLKEHAAKLWHALLADVAVEPLNRLLALRLEETTGAAVEVTVASRKKHLEQLSACKAPKIANLTKLYNIVSRGARRLEDATKDIESVCEIYSEAASNANMFCRKLDKKKEKTLLQEERATCREQLAEAALSDLASLCCLGLRLSLLQDGVIWLPLPCNPALLRAVAGRLTDEALKEQTLQLIDLLQRQQGAQDSSRASSASSFDAVSAEAAAAAWRDRILQGAKT
eukprot:TRINITY_DN56588_c0_g1_i1.p1 TRINITY_DN56588_c0_g1~~TRINITY_DN56588_c0_g1_i1.p1  ORF type:complete len:715 (+),score=158.72 TRINITY_DN56588_c0_g1_i1:191-2335(+)